MALVVNTDPFNAACNSYASIAFADDYALLRVPSDTVQAAWAALDTPDKSMYLVNATRFLDSAAVWIGDRYSRDQQLDWPRTNAWVQGFLLDVTTFPRRLVEATVEMALFTMGLEGEVSVAEQDSLGAIQVGPIHLKFNNDSGQPAVRYFPDIVAYLLRDLGSLTDPNTPSNKSIKVVTLQRA